MTVEEIERHLVAVIRQKQSVAAMKLWIEIHRGEQDADDPLLRFAPGGQNGRR